MLVIYGRMIEVYLTTSVGPIPLATMTNRDWSHTGQNYLKSLFALAFQAFLIMVCVGIYSVLVQSIATDGNISGAIWACMGYTVLLCFALFKTGSLSKSLFGAHYGTEAMKAAGDHIEHTSAYMNCQEPDCAYHAVRLLTCKETMVESSLNWK